MSYRHTVTLLASALLSLPAVASDVYVEAYVDAGYAIGSGFASGRTGDLDGDGHLDLIGTDNSVSNFLRTALNNGDGTFSDGPSTSLSGGVICVDHALRDLNSDGLDDWVCANVVGSSPVYLGNGDGSFTFATNLAPAQGVGIGDADGDGSLDVITTSNGNVTVYTGDGAGTFTQARAFTAAFAQDAVVAELDGVDGPELVLASNQGGAHIYDWDSDTVETTIGSAATRMSTVADFDGDGSPDIALMNEGSSEIYFNDGAGNFSAGTMGCQLNWVPAAYIVDIDGDGDLDMLDENNNNAGDTCINDGTGTFTAGPQYATGTSGGWRTSVGDYDNDGFVDVAMYSANTTPTTVNFADPSLLPVEVSASSDGVSITVDIAGTDLQDGDVIRLAATRRGAGPGRCFRILNGDCLGLRSKVHMMALIDIDATASGSTTVPVPSVMSPGDILTVQPVVFRNGLYVSMGSPYDIEI
jgi:hypothetical protein